jgi:hypothetical protein
VRFFAVGLVDDRRCFNAWWRAMAAPRLLNPAEKLDWLRLIRSENVGPIGIM